MKNKMISFVIVGLFVAAGLMGFLYFGTETAVGTAVSGPVYDGSGGPWTIAGSPYIVVGDIYVPAGETLTIEPGVEVRFDGYFTLYVEGTLLAQGIAPEIITMTSNMATPDLGDWNGVVIGSGGHGEVRYCQISYATIGILLQSSYNNVTDSDVVLNRDTGIYLVYSNENNIVNNNASDNQYGIFLLQSEINQITNNIAFSHNYELYNGSSVASNAYGIYLDTSNGNDIIGNNLSRNNALGIYLSDSHDNVIANNDLYMNSVGGLNLSHSDANVVSGNTVSSNGEFGIMIDSGSGNEIDGNAISDSIYGIHLGESDATIVSGNIMTNNGIVISGPLLEHWNTHTIDMANTVNGKPAVYLKDQTGGNVPAGAGQVILTNCQFVRVENQVITHGTLGIELGFSSYNYIMNNVISFNNIKGLYAYSCQGNYISRNNASSNMDIGIHLYKSSYHFISRNQAFSGNIGVEAGDGIYLEYSDNNYIAHNTVVDMGYGIALFYCSNNIVIGNDISTDRSLINQWGGGIHLFNAQNTAISYNSISRTGEGIYIQNSDSIMVTGNDVSLNKGEGIRCWVSSNVVIVYNELLENTIGIRIFDSNFGFFMHHNNLIASSYLQAEDGESNQWDDGYPSGGNYWSDYTGVDVNQGPGQDIPGSDGIGDAPYVIDGDSQDNYPLMEPYQPYENSVKMKEGWNLVSLPLIQSDSSLDSVLKSVELDYDSVTYFSASDTIDPWKQNHVAKPPSMNDLNTIDHTMGFWVRVTSPEGTELVLDGIPHSTPQNIQLHPGWNLVGYPSLSDKIRAEALNNVVFGTDIESVWAFDGNTQAWEELGDSDYFEVGRGYWIYSLVEKTWEVPL